MPYAWTSAASACCRRWRSGRVGALSPTSGWHSGSCARCSTLRSLILRQAACSDPGIVYRELGSDDVARRFCSRCDFERPIEARHCYDCDLCVRDLDHHCPWTGKCIGAKTIRNFYAFLVCLLVHLVYVVVMTVYFFVRP